MLVEIFHDLKLYIRAIIHFDEERLEVEEGPNFEVKIVHNSFEYANGFNCDFHSIVTYLNNRGIDKDTPTGVYDNVDSNVRIVVLNNDKL